MIEFFNHYISPASPLRAQISVHLIAQGKSASNGETENTDTAQNGTSTTSAKDAIQVTDVHAWKSSLVTNPGPRAVSDLSEFEDLESKL